MPVCLTYAKNYSAQLFKELRLFLFFVNESVYLCLIFRIYVFAEMYVWEVRKYRKANYKIVLLFSWGLLTVTKKLRILPDMYTLKFVFTRQP